MLIVRTTTVISQRWKSQNNSWESCCGIASPRINSSSVMDVRDKDQEDIALYFESLTGQPGAVSQYQKVTRQNVPGFKII